MTADKILFIDPPLSHEPGIRYNNLKMPLGYLYMAGNLEKHGFKVKILSCPLYWKKKRVLNNGKIKIGLFPDEIKKVIKKFQPDIVGVSCAYSAYESDSFEVISLVKQTAEEIKKKILILVGGAHTSANPEYVLRNKDIALAVIGEGEETVLEIAERYKHKKKMNNIKGTALRERDKIKINKPREFIKNIDELKPAWGSLNLPLYFSHPDNSAITLRKPAIDIITSRGCVGNCVFCSIHTVWGRNWRGRSARNIVDEIEFLIKKYHVKQFRFQDDNLTLDKKRIMQICNEIIRRNLDIKWDTPNGIAIWTLNPALLKKMKSAGCYRVTFGIESGCEKSQKYIRKIIDLKKINELIDYCHKIGLWVCATFIIGFPYETKQDIEKTRNFIINSKINFPFIYIAQPLPGTDLYNDFKKEGLLNKLETASNVHQSKYNTLYFTNLELNKMRRAIFRQFYIQKIISYANPFVFYREFLSKIRAFEDITYIFKNLFTFLRGLGSF